MRSMLRATCLALVLAASSSALAQDDQAPAPVNIRVTSTPTGAAVEVVGRGAVGRTPIRALSLPYGTYDFVFTRRGYARTVVHATLTSDGEEVTARLERPAFLQVRAEHLNARGARILVDGQAAGTVPGRIEVAPGRRLVEVEAEGFLSFGQWVDAVSGQTGTVDVRLVERPSTVGSILVTTDTPDAEVIIDGQRRGRAPHLAHGISPGEHRVEVTSGNRRGELTIQVRADAREIAHIALAEQPPTPGSAAVQTEPTGATVLVDGEPRGQTPLTLEQLTPGAHMLEITLEGFVAERRVVTIESGVRAEVSATLSRGAPQPGRIVVHANREDAFVQVDGLSRGRVPLTLENVQPGAHAVRVVATGAAPFESQCVITSGETCTIDAQLRAGPVRVRVTAQMAGEDAAGAVLFVDGTEAGELPWEGELAIGAHQLEARAPGASPASHAITIEAGMPPQSLGIALERIDEPSELTDPPPTGSGTTPAAPEAPQPFIPRSGAEALTSGRVSFAFFLGWPYLLGAELDVGLLGPVDIGIAARTFGRVTELELHTRVGFRLADIIALGGWARLSAGIGPDDINAFTGKIDARVTLLPTPEVGISAWIGVDFSSDEYPFTEQDAGMRLSGDVGRQDLIRGRVGGAVDWRFASQWSLGLRMEGMFASTGGHRRLLGDVLELGNPDTEVYGEIHAGFEI